MFSFLAQIMCFSSFLAGGESHFKNFSGLKRLHALLAATRLQRRLVAVVLADVDAEVAALLGFVVAVGALMARLLAAALDVLVATQGRLPAIALAAVTALVLAAGLFAVAGHRVVADGRVVFLAGRVAASVLRVLALVRLAEVDLHVFGQFDVVDAVLQVVHHLVGEVIALIACVGGRNLVLSHLLGAGGRHRLDDVLLSVVCSWKNDGFGDGRGGLDRGDADVLDLLAVGQDLGRADGLGGGVVDDLGRLLCLSGREGRVLVARVFDARVVRLVYDLLLLGDGSFWHFLNDGDVGGLLNLRHGLLLRTLDRDQFCSSMERRNDVRNEING